MEPNDSLAAARAAALAELRRRPRARPWWWDAAAVAGLNVACAAVLLIAHGWSDAATRSAHAHPAVTWLGVGLLAVISVAGSVVALRPGGRLVQLSALALVVATSCAVALGASGISAGTSPWGSPTCAAFELASSLIPAAAALTALRLFDFQPLRAVLAGLAAGAGGMLALHVSCPDGGLAHLLAYHLAPWSLVALGLVLVRRRLSSASFVP